MTLKTDVSEAKALAEVQANVPTGQEIDYHTHNRRDMNALRFSQRAARRPEPQPLRSQENSQ